MKILFMGTPEFAAVNLKAIVDKHDVVAVVSQPEMCRFMSHRKFLIFRSMVA